MGPAFQIAGIQVVIPRKEVQTTPETAYEDTQRPMKDLIRELQSHDDWVRLFRTDPNAMPERRRTRSKAWSVDQEGLLRHQNRLYIPGDAAIREELISRCHDDPLSGHFGAAKTYELLSRKYHWDGCLKDVTKYVKTCDIC